MNKNSETERQFRLEAAARGFEILHKGYPDYCLVKDGQAFFVEVKKPSMVNGPKKGMSKHQKRMQEVLKENGLFCEVYYGTDGFWNNLQEASK